MKKVIMSLAAASAMAVAGGDIVQVQEVQAPWTGVYAGGALTANQTYVKGESDWFSTSNLNKTSYGIQGDLGYTFMNTGSFALSAEGRLGTSVGGDDYVETTYWGIYAKPEAIFNGFSVYALAGYGSLDYTATDDIYYGGYPVEYSVTETVTGFTWGLGTQIAVNDSMSVFVDYVVQPSLSDVAVNTYNALETRDIETDVISVGVNFRF